jgi:hypothetical protein
MSILSDPQRFLDEKLQKRFLSINTVRDGMLASMILSLQKKEEMRRGGSLDDAWRQGFVAGLRGKMAEICEENQIPTEYPTLEQLKLLRARLEEVMEIDRLDFPLREAHQQVCDRLFEKAEE